MTMSGVKDLLKYHHLRDVEAAEEGKEPALRRRASAVKDMLMSPVLPWVLCALLSLLVFLDSVHIPIHREASRGTYEQGFKTELGIVRPLIRLQTSRFYGAFRLDPNGTYYLTSKPGAKRYAGPPDAQVDAAWRELLYGRFSGLSKQEAGTMSTDFIPDDFKHDRLYWEPSVTHNLHCINYLRKALDKDYYPDIDVSRKPEIPWESSHRMHLDHCIDILRQNVMCHVDMTPVPRTWVAPGDFWHADPDQVHTCRDFSALREWISDRNRRFPEPNPTEND